VPPPTVPHSEFRSLRRFPALDGVRAIAVLLVVFAHSRGPRPLHYLAGWNGVTIFFVLSGFLITTLALREEERSGRMSLLGFSVRRVFRILPLYLLVLLLYVPIVLVLHIGDAAKFTHALPFFASPLPEIPFFTGGGHVPFEISWSLGIEEKFYVLWPLIAFGLLYHSKRARLPLAIALAVALWLAELAPHASRFVFPYFHILVGCVVAMLLHDRRGYDRLRHLGRRELALPLLVVAAVLQIWSSFGLPPLVVPIYTLAVAALLVGLIVSARSSTGVLARRPLVYIGAISYALYLTHQLGLGVAEELVPAQAGWAADLGALAIGLGVAITLCAVLHRWIETPMIERGRRLATAVSGRNDGGEFSARPGAVVAPSLVQVTVRSSR
jgi:peptidoglycan/LPS O-acetylase OafA/YrhL